MSDKQEKKAVQCIFTEEQRKARDEFEKRARAVSDSHSSTLVIKIDGGLGRNIAMTGIITEVAKKRKVKVIASRPLAFWGNPYIESVHGLGDRRLFQDVIRGNDYVEIEPYTNPRFFNDGENRLKIVGEQFGFNEIIYPKLFLAEREKKAYKLDGNAVLFQPFGSTMDLNGSDKSYRSIPVEQAQYMAEQLMKKGYTVYTCESEKQPELRGVNTLRKITDLRYIVGLCSKYKVIGCDSCLHHASVSFGMKPTVFRAGTDSKRFGYDDLENNVREFEMKEYTPMRLPMNDFDFDNSNQGTNDFTIEFIDKVLEKF